MRRPFAGVENAEERLPSEPKDMSGGATSERREFSPLPLNDVDILR